VQRAAWGTPDDTRTIRAFITEEEHQARRRQILMPLGCNLGASSDSRGTRRDREPRGVKAMTSEWRSA
jgi:hypothetical protein